MQSFFHSTLIHFQLLTHTHTRYTIVFIHLEQESPAQVNLARVVVLVYNNMNQKIYNVL
jgi:hypothetical protein